LAFVSEYDVHLKKQKSWKHLYQLNNDNIENPIFLSMEMNSDNRTKWAEVNYGFFLKFYSDEINDEYYYMLHPA